MQYLGLTFLVALFFMSGVRAQAQILLNSTATHAEGVLLVDGQQLQVTTCRLQIVRINETVTFFISANGHNFLGHGFRVVAEQNFLHFGEQPAPVGKVVFNQLQSGEGQLHYRGKAAGERYLLQAPISEISLSIDQYLGKPTFAQVKTGYPISLSWNDEFFCDFRNSH